MSCTPVALDAVERCAASLTSALEPCAGPDLPSPGNACCTALQAVAAQCGEAFNELNANLTEEL